MHALVYRLEPPCAPLEAFRLRHDPLAGRLDAHLTLVFPVAGVDEAVLRAHAVEVARGVAPVPLRLRGVHATDDGYLVLDPVEGAAPVAALHDRLYRGPLAPHLRTDPPYRPHVTLGRTGSEGGGRALEEAAALGLEVERTLDALTLLRWRDGGPFEVAAVVPLIGESR